MYTHHLSLQKKRILKIIILLFFYFNKISSSKCTRVEVGTIMENQHQDDGYEKESIHVEIDCARGIGFCTFKFNPESNQ